MTGGAHFQRQAAFLFKSQISMLEIVPCNKLHHTGVGNKVFFRPNTLPTKCFSCVMKFKLRNFSCGV